jgi:hypothetical protein
LRPPRRAGLCACLPQAGLTTLGASFPHSTFYNRRWAFDITRRGGQVARRFRSLPTFREEKINKNIWRAKQGRRKASPPRRKVIPSGPQFLCALRGGQVLASLREEKKNRARKAAKAQSLRIDRPAARQGTIFYFVLRTIFYWLNVFT